MGYEALLEARAGDEAQAVEQLAQGMRPLRGVLAYQRETRRAEGPLVVKDIAGIAGAGGSSHPLMLPNDGAKVHHRLWLVGWTVSSSAQDAFHAGSPLIRPPRPQKLSFSKGGEGDASGRVVAKTCGVTARKPG